MDMQELLEATKVASKSANYSALARTLKTTPASVSNWRLGRNYPDAVACAKIAKITGFPLARVLGIVGEARAISREEKAVWRRLASAAAGVFLTVSGVLAFPTNGHAGTESISRNQGNTAYYVLRLRRIARLWKLASRSFWRSPAWMT